MKKRDNAIKDIVEFNELEEIIRKCKICRVGMVDVDTPYVLAMNFGYDDQKNNPRTMKHCTDCGRILLASEEVCPSCEGTNIRPNIGAGTEIVMTVQGKHV